MENLLKAIGTNQGILLVVGGVLLFIVPIPVTHFTGALFLFTAFDVFGFKYVDQNRGSIEYRILQNLFGLLLLFYLFQVDEWTVGVGALVSWYLLVCDVLYYVVIEQDIDDFTWFTISPVVFFFTKILHRPAPALAVVLSSFIGIGVSLYFIFYYAR